MEEVGDFQDWEMLRITDKGSVHSFDSEENLKDFEGIEGDPDGVVKSNYFTLDSEKIYARTVAEGDLSEEGSVYSVNPSGVDPCSEVRYGDDAGRGVDFQGIVLERKNTGESGPESSNERSVSWKKESGCGDDAKNEVGFEEFEETEGLQAMGMDSGEVWADSGGDGSAPMKFGNVEGEGDSVSGDYETRKDEPEVMAEVEGVNGSESGVVVEVGGGNGLGRAVVVEAESGEVPEGMEAISSKEVKSGKEETRMVWWKLPWELLKLSVFKASPVWSFSIAAAMMGFAILGRRLYKMRRKSRSIQLNVTLEDKKVSQFMVRVARLNEAFSVVRRVPVIRASLPAAGVTPWPVMSMR